MPDPEPFVWTIDPEGDGVIYTRSARADNAGESLVGQLRLVMDVAGSAELRPRTVIAEGGVSGNARVHERPGFRVIEEELEAGCTWLGASDLSRISREWAAVTSFAAHLAQRRTRLVLGSHGLVDWSDAGRVGIDQLALDLLTRVRVHRNTEIRRRTRNLLTRGVPKVVGEIDSA